MNEIMEWLADNYDSMLFVAALHGWLMVPLGVYACGALWRWWRGRRGRRERNAPHAYTVVFQSQGDVTTSGADIKYTIEFLPPAAWPDEPPQLSGNPGELPDHKYQGDQVTSLRKELLALEERVKLHDTLITRLDRHLSDAEERVGKLEYSQFANSECAPVTPASVEAGVRVFKDGSWCRLFHGAAGHVNTGIGWCPSALALGTAVRLVRLFPDFTELPKDSPEYQRIVESWMAWRRGQQG